MNYHLTQDMIGQNLGNRISYKEMSKIGTKRNDQSILNSIFCMIYNVVRQKRNIVSKNNRYPDVRDTSGAFRKSKIQPPQRDFHYFVCGKLVRYVTNWGLSSSLSRQGGTATLQSVMA